MADVSASLSGAAYFFGDGVDVVGQRQGHDIGFQTVNDRPGLLAGTAMRLLDFHRFTTLAIPMLGESRIKLLIEFASGIVGNIEQGGFRERGQAHPNRQGKGEQGVGKMGNFHQVFSRVNNLMNYIMRLLIIVMNKNGLLISAAHKQDSPTLPRRGLWLLLIQLQRQLLPTFYLARLSDEN